MPAGGIASAGVGLLLGLGEGIWGASEKKKYQNQINALNANRPQYEINPEEYNMVNLAESRANQGMGGAARQQLQNNTDRTLATTANAALMGGADANSIGNLVDKSQQAYNQNAIYDDQARMQNLANLQQSWARMSADKDKQWDINKEQPWKDKMTALSQQLAGANNMMMSGFNLAGSGLMSGVGKAFGGGGGNSGGGDGGGGYGGYSGGGDGGGGWSNGGGMSYGPYAATGSNNNWGDSADAPYGMP